MAGVGVASVSWIRAVGIISIPVPTVPPPSMVVVRVVMIPVPSVFPGGRAVSTIRPAFPLLPVRMVCMVGGLGRYIRLVMVRGAARHAIAPRRVPVPLPISVSLSPVSVTFPVPLSFGHWRRLVQGSCGGHVRVRGHVHPSGASVVIRGVTGKRGRRGETGPTSVVHRGVLRRNSVRLVIKARLEPGRRRHGG